MKAQELANLLREEIERIKPRDVIDLSNASKLQIALLQNMLEMMHMQTQILSMILDYVKPQKEESLNENGSEVNFKLPPKEGPQIQT